MCFSLAEKLLFCEMFPMCPKGCRNAFVMHFSSFQAQINWKKLVSEKSEKLWKNVVFSGWKTPFLWNVTNVSKTVWNCVEMYFWSLQAQRSWKNLFQKNHQNFGKMCFLSNVANVPEIVWNCVKQCRNTLSCIFDLSRLRWVEKILF